jgi:GT2 family glycosyltransferase
MEAAAFRAWLESDRILSMPTFEEVEVSIILVLFNQAALTWGCLRSILETAHRPFEVILVDNASTDETGLLLQRITGARVLRNPENLHFLRAANQGAQSARGSWLLFMNNDTLLASGALEAALDVFRHEERVGAVGARIVKFDGLLQEAGNIVFADGGCAGYGRGDDPEKPEYQFRRAVDYVSGCFLLTSRTIFEALGGFDEAFVPAYYEESDYCLRLAVSGYRVLYEPRAVLFHKEYGSSNAEQAAALMQRNRALFVERHRERLAHHPEPGSNHLWARHHPERRKRVLFIDDAIPHLDRGGGLPRANAIAHGRSELGGFATFYPMSESKEQTWAEVYADLPRGLEVMRGSSRDGLTEFLSSRAGYYEAVMVSRPHNMRHLQDALAAVPHALGEARLVYDAEALFARREMAWERLQGRLVSEEEARQRIAEEVALTHDAHCITAVCSEEAALLGTGESRRVLVLGHAMLPEPAPEPWEARHGFLFMGRLDDHGSPNWDAVVYFMRRIMPLVQRVLGASCKLTLLGETGAGLALELAGGDVVIAGRVPDIRPYAASARVFVAPTRFAAGIPHKVHQAAALGLPVVASNMLAQSLGWQDGRELLAADPAQPERFAEQCIRLYQDRTLWTRVREAALQAVARDCDPQRFRETLGQALFGH